MRNGRRSTLRAFATVVLLGLYGAVALIGPVGAHSGTSDHVWKHLRSLRKTLRTAGTINAPRNPMHWTKLTGVPATIADGFDEPAIFGAAKNGPADLPGVPLNAAGSTIGTLNLPAGNYAIFAKAYFTQSGTNQVVECELVAGGSTDKSVVATQSQSPSTATGLQTTHVFAAPGSVLLRCTDNDGAGTAVAYSNVRITAISGSTLTSSAA